MRTQCTTLVVLLLVAMVTAQQVITNFEEYQRKKAEYDVQKAKYDEFQSLSQVPVLASYDLIPKIKDADAPPGRAEQLLPNYTGETVKFQGAGGGAGVEPGNTPQNYFHQGPIPAKKSSGGAKPEKVVIPTGPGQAFIVPQGDDTSATVTATTSADATPTPAPAPAAVDPVTPPASTAAPAAAPPPFSPFSPSSGTALFFERGALPVTTAVVQTDAPRQASVSFAARAAPTASAAPAAAVVRPLGKQYLFGPVLPHSDFHPGPARAVAPLFAPAPAPAPVRTFAPAPVRAFAPAPVRAFATAPVRAFTPTPVLARSFIPSPVAARSRSFVSSPVAVQSRSFTPARIIRPAQRYGAPGFSP